MKDQEQPPVRDDESDNEIIDLNTWEGEHVPDPAGSSPPSPARVSLKSRLTPHQRFLRLAATVAIILIVIMLILNSNPATRTMAFGWLNRLGRPAPSPTISASSIAAYAEMRLFAVNASPSWGKLAIDGGSFSPVDPAAWFSLKKGHHTLIWRAEPFRVQVCTLSLPQQPSDTCYHQTQYSQYGPQLETIFFYESLKMLPATQQSTLLQTVRQLLDAQQAAEIVRPAEVYLHYQHGNTTFERATQTLQATHRFILDTSNTPISSCVVVYNTCTLPVGNPANEQLQNCLSFCTDNSDASLPTDMPDTWGAVVVMHTVWDYKTLDGRIVAQNEPDTMPAETQFELLLYLSVTWNGQQWHAAIRQNVTNNGENNLACLSASSINFMYLYDSPIFGNGRNTGFTSVQPVPGPTSATGCLIKIQPTVGNPFTPEPMQAKLAVAYILYRFGVILAANDAAHQYWPKMPVADSYERGLVQQWG